jgi:Zn-dependent M16 (insulinase) family peptidase
MMTKKRLFRFASFIAIAVVAGFTFYSCGKQVNIPGYKLISKKFVKEVNAEVYYFEHIKSGAHVVKFVVDDANKTFGVGFRTEPNSDCGTSHILEHSVLNGSKNFPVKSPFTEMGKTSLNTFLNAFTSSDWTFYPVASMNEKDYFNLMTVYLDAVFFPLIKTEPRIFMQEGWHYELEDKDSPIVIKGVVYNEMKGAYSSPQREMSYQIGKNLFPDNGYGKSSGGYPQAIPELTYEDFIAYYEKNYHPSNSCIFVYGNADMKKELELIDKQYLSYFDKIEVDNEIKLQEPFTEFKKVEAPYASLEGVPTENQTFISLNWVYGLGTDQKLSWALSILSDVLVNQEAGPVRLALQEAGIGQNMYSYAGMNQQNGFNITIQNANPEDADKAKEIILNKMKEVAEQGIDRSSVEAFVNRIEFHLREGDDAQKGLSAMLQSYQNWMFTKDPYAGLQWEKQLADTKKAIEENYLEQVLNEAIINNNFGLMMVMVPKPGMEREINEQTTKKLAEYKASLSEEEIEKLIADTKDLIAYQQKENTEEELAVLPKLGREDLNPKADWYEAEERNIADIKVVHFENFTNGIVYVKLMYDLRVIPNELIPYAQLLGDILGLMGTENYSFGDLEKEINKNTGGVQTYITTYKQDRDDNKLLPKFVLESKAVPSKIDKMFELGNEVLYKTNLADKDRLKTILTRNLAQTESNVKRNGLGYAMTRSNSYFSNSGMFSELTRGLEYYWFLAKLVTNFDTNSDMIVDNLKKTADLLFTRNNLILASSCDKADYSNLEKAFTNFAANLPEKESTIVDWNFDLTKKNEALISSSKVQYVVQSYNYKKLGYDWDARMSVLSSILSGEYLQNTVRVIGGAYGGFSGISSDGNFYFASYRDPNLKETLDNYAGAVKYVESFEANEAKMLGYIIGTISNYDYPETASSKANTAFNRYFTNATAAERQADRDAILSTTDENIRSFSKMIEDVLKQNNICVYGSEEKINANKNLFGGFINVEKKN